MPMTMFFHGEGEYTKPKDLLIKDHNKINKRDNNRSSGINFTLPNRDSKKKGNQCA